MSTRESEGLSGKKAAQSTTKSTETSIPGSRIESKETSTSGSKAPVTPPKLTKEKEASDTKSPAAGKHDQPSESTSPTTPEDPHTARPRQVIAVSASKGPAAFFNLARKFLVTDEMCDLSALEGAIVSAVDAAHLLERSKLATIVRVQTSYVSVEPKRRKSQQPQADTSEAQTSAGEAVSSTHPQRAESPSVAASPSVARGGRSGSSSGRELRRARIVITVKRTESYKRWLEENPLQAIIAGDGGDEDDDEGHVDEDVERH